MVVRLGHAVELAPGPGEAAPRVARVEALWAEPRGRCLGSLRRFYRPEARAHGRPLGMLLSRRVQTAARLPGACRLLGVLRRAAAAPVAACSSAQPGAR